MGDRFAELEKSVRAIEERNRRVEADKDWETSLMRRGILTVLTYVIAGCILLSINAESPWLSALIPTAGYVLSTLSLSFIKTLWIERR